MYWKPVYYVLEDEFETWVVNARHFRNVPGRKTDVLDAAWLAELAQHGLLRPSFVPPKEIRELRLQAVPLALDHCFTRLATEDDAAWIRRRFRSACRAFGTEVVEEGGRLVVTYRS